jgi:DNA-binding response OmpR family regulator
MAKEQSELPGDNTEGISRLKSHLLGSGRLTEDQFLQAEDYALTRKISIQEAVLFLNLIDYTGLGQSLAKIYGKPYRPLLNDPPLDAAKAVVPLKFAERWAIFPVAYDPEKNFLVLAVGDPTDQQLIEQVKSIFPPPFRLAFTVASAAEIEKAIEVHYKGKEYIPAPELKVPKDFTILADREDIKEDLTPEEKAHTERKILLLEPDRARAAALKTILRGEGYLDVAWVLSPRETVKALKREPSDLLLVNGRFFQPKGSWLKDISQEIELPRISYYHLKPFLLGQEHSYHQMSQALIDLAAFLVRERLKDNRTHLQETLARAKYCKLLALRLGLRPGQVDGVVLAAWLSGEGLGRELVGRVATPYGLEEIVEPRADAENQHRVEADILSLVKTYQALKKNESEAARDINQLRRRLRGQCPSPKAEALLEAFLHLLQDEEFLRKVDQPGGHILVVDPTQSQGSSMVLRLSNDGYEVEVVADAREAMEAVSKSQVDLVVSEVNLPVTEGLKFCRAIRKNAATAHIPFLFLTAEEGERLAAECLEAGADDFLKKPVDSEMLSLKIQRMLAMKAPPEAKRGVSGSLTEMNSTDFIQSLSAGEKDVEIDLEHGGEKGKIYMQQGQIIHADTDSLSGEEAFYSLMTWEEGEFQILPCSHFPTRTIHAPTMSLLIEGARLVDEARDK